MEDKNSSYTILNKISGIVDINELLTIFDDELMKIDGIDGYHIDLLDANKEYLIIKKIKLHDEYKEMQGVLEGKKYELNDTTFVKNCIDKNVIKYLHKNDTEGLDDRIKFTQELWHIHCSCFIPVKLNDFPIGVVWIYNKESELDEETVDKVIKLINIFANQLKSAFLYTYLHDKISQMEIVINRKLEVLSIAEQVMNLSSTEMIYQIIIDELLKILNLDMGIIFIKNENTLEYVKGDCSDKEGINKYFEKVDKYLNKIEGYKIEITEGATSFAFLNNDHIYFEDAQKVLGLPMSTKDKAYSDIVKDVCRTFLIMPITKNNIPLGILHLWSYKEVVPINEQDIEILKSLCAFIGTAIKNAELYSLVEKQKKEILNAKDDLEEKNIRISKDLEMAKTIQENILPKNQPIIGNYNINSLYKPIQALGGDFYDFIKIDDDNLGIFISDVSGHGVAPSLITAMIKANLNLKSEDFISPSTFLKTLQRKIFPLLKQNYITAFYSVLNHKKNTITFSSAGHIPQLLFKSNENKIKKIATETGTVIGLFIDEKYPFIEKTIKLEKDDVVMLFTDGLVQNYNLNNNVKDSYSYEHLVSYCKNNLNKNNGNFLSNVESKIQISGNNNLLSDDVAIILVKRVK